MSSKDPQAQAESGINLPIHLSPMGNYLKDAANKTVADLRYFAASHEAKQFIVRAVNCHAELLEALKLAEIWLANCMPISEPTKEKPLPIIHAAIEKAEKQP